MKHVNDILEEPKILLKKTKIKKEIYEWCWIIRRCRINYSRNYKTLNSKGLCLRTGFVRFELWQFERQENYSNSERSSLCTVLALCQHSDWREEQRNKERNKDTKAKQKTEKIHTYTILNNIKKSVWNETRPLLTVGRSSRRYTCF